MRGQQGVKGFRFGTDFAHCLGGTEDILWQTFQFTEELWRDQNLNAFCCLNLVYSVVELELYVSQSWVVHWDISR